MTNKDFKEKEIKHEKDIPRFHDPKLSKNAEDFVEPPYSDQEHELHRIRDRIRIRLNLIEIDFRNLESQLTYEQKKRLERQKPLASMLDMDKNNESEKEAIDSDVNDIDEV